VQPPFIFFTHSSLLLSAEILQKLLLPLLISLDSNLILFLERLHSRISIPLSLDFNAAALPFLQVILFLEVTNPKLSLTSPGQLH